MYKVVTAFTLLVYSQGWVVSVPGIQAPQHCDTIIEKIKKDFSPEVKAFCIPTAQFIAPVDPSEAAAQAAEAAKKSLEKPAPSGPSSKAPKPAKPEGKAEEK